MSDTVFDVVVMGMGPGGETVAGSLADEGLSVLGIDRRLVGGECPYWGCNPTKMMVRAAGLLAEARRVDGMAGTAKVASDWAPVARAHSRGGHRQLGRPCRSTTLRRQGRHVRPRRGPPCRAGPRGSR